MKVTLNIIMLLWSWQVSCAPTDSLLNCLQNDLEKNNIKGNVKSITFCKKIMWPEHYQDVWIKDSVYRFEYTYSKFNTQGFLTEKWHDSLKKYPFLKFRIELDIEKSSVVRSVLTIESDTSQIEWPFYPPQTSIYEGCLLVKQLERNNIISFSYDSENKMTEKVTTSISGDTPVTERVTYFGKSKVITEVFVSDQLEMKEIRKFNRNGALAKYVAYDGQGNLITKRQLKYDKYNNPVKSKELGDLTEIQYEYDEYQNWKRAKTSINGTTRFIETRIIKYY